MTISMSEDSVEFSFPEVDPAATMRVTFQRTLRVPDDGTQYGLPPGLGSFPVRRVADLGVGRVPRDWARRGGVVMPMWQAEACWLSFDVPQHYSFLVKVGCGGINAVTGAPFTAEPDFAAEDYFEVPAQPWLDGFCTEQGVVRQFVAMPLHRGYTVEEQLTGEAEHGGIQLVVIPLTGEVYREREAARLKAAAEWQHVAADMDLCMPMAAPSGAAMGMGAGGSITQSIETPVEPRENWRTDRAASLSVHLANSAAWSEITGEQPPTVPPSAADYTRMGFPWFEWYDDTFARQGSSVLAKVKSVLEFGRSRDEAPLSENESFDPPEPVVLGRPPSDLVSG
jgi:hypothetical protein